MSDEEKAIRYFRAMTKERRQLFTGTMFSMTEERTIYNSRSDKYRTDILFHLSRLGLLKVVKPGEYTLSGLGLEIYSKFTEGT